MIRFLPLVVALSAVLGWSDPIPIATTSTAVPPAVAVAAGRVHVFWLDRRGPVATVGDLWHAVLSADGRLARSPSRLRSSVDSRLAFPVAVPWREAVAAAWMTRTPEGVRLEVAVLDSTGALRTILRPDPTPREEAGRIALAASPDGTLHAAWSQFDGDQRRIWYTSVRAAGRGYTPPIAVAIGDAPALLLDPAPRLFWWEGVGAGGFRLVAGSLASGRLVEPRPLTGTISLAYPLPVLPATTGAGSVLLIPTLERTFSTSGRLYVMRLGPGVRLPPRVPVLGQSRVSDVSLARDGGTPVAVWSQAVGRRQNSELYAAPLIGQGQAFLEPPSRVTYTIPGSLKPAAALIEGAPAAVWLEVTGFGEFSLSFGTSAAPRNHRFLLAITELDLYRPGALLPFAVLVILSILPLALLLTFISLLPATVVLLLAQQLAAPFRRCEQSLQMPVIRLAIVLIAALAIEVTARVLIPGTPTPALIAVPLSLVGVPVLAVLTRREVGPLALGLTAAGVVLVQAAITLFPWGAAQLSQY